MVEAAKKWSTAALGVNRRISVGGGILAILVLGEAIWAQMRHFA